LKGSFQKCKSPLGNAQWGSPQLSAFSSQLFFLALVDNAEHPGHGEIDVVDPEGIPCQDEVHVIL